MSLRRLSVWIGALQAVAVIAAALSHDAALLWGPYRPNLYVGMRPRIPGPLLLGLMWSNADEPSKIHDSLRHTCEQNEGMSYGWTAYDVRSGGREVLNDTGNWLDLITDFAKMPGNPHAWGLKVQGTPRTDAISGSKSMVVFYIGNEDPASQTECTKDAGTGGISCQGTSSGLGDFKIDIKVLESSHDHKQSISSLAIPTEDIWQAKSKFVDLLKHEGTHNGLVSDAPEKGNLQFTQQTFEGAFEFDILFSPLSAEQQVTSASLKSAIEASNLAFERQFEATYAPQAPFADKQHRLFSQSLISNLLGGIGYFYGKDKTDASHDPAYDETEQQFWEKAAEVRKHAKIEERGPFELYTAVPSRPFFPRGFLWDEGFHLQVILDWDTDLALEILSSWFDLMDRDGWIAREQILGPEARSKVPEQFQVQYPHYANPPTLFLVAQAFAAKLHGVSPHTGAPSAYLQDAAKGKAYLRSLYPKLKKNYEWFRKTQQGNLRHYHYPGTSFSEGYRWRGRDLRHTLTSGLDDYPRAQPPHPNELHVDTLSWVGSMAMALEKIALVLGNEEDQTVYAKQITEVSRSIDGIHWSSADKAYCDVTVREGIHVERVCHKGYISLFPFLVGLLNARHPRLGAVLDLIRDPDALWSPHGIRSLSTQDAYYGTAENYWRSPVWININYMVLERLLELAKTPGPRQKKARDTYAALRTNLVNTVYESWQATGFAWEQYDPSTGAGQRTQYFTGWTALMVRVMAMPNLAPPAPKKHAWLEGRQPFSFSSAGILMAIAGLLVVAYAFRRKVLDILQPITGSQG